MNVYYIYREVHLYASIYIKFNKHFNLKGYFRLLLLLGENIVNLTQMKPRAKTHCNSLDRETWVQVHIFLFSKTEAVWSLKLCFTHNVAETQQCGPIKVLIKENQMCSHFFLFYYFFSLISQRNLFSEFLTFYLFRKNISHYFNKPPKYQISVPKNQYSLQKGKKVFRTRKVVEKAHVPNTLLLNSWV